MKQTRIDAINNALTRLNKIEKNKYKNFVLNEKEVEEKMNKYSVFKYRRINYILTNVKRPYNYPKANFLGTRMALVGILENGEDLRDFIEYQMRLNFILEMEYDRLLEEYYRHTKREQNKEEIE